MLKKTEMEILRALNGSKNDKDTCLLSPKELVELCSPKYKIDEITALNALKKLENEDCLDIIYSTGKGKPVYCITLHPKGVNYLAERRKSYSAIKFKIFLAVLGAVVSFIAGRLLYYLFT